MLRAALICDYSEERWLSMDLVADVLFEQLGRWHAATIRVDRIRPALRRRCSAPGVLRSSRTAWNFDRLWNRMVEYPLRLRPLRHGYDLYHIVDHSYAHLALSLRGRPAVVTCHDLEVFRCLTHPATEPRPRWFRMMAAHILKGLRSAAHVIFVSHTVMRQATALGLLPENRGTVIPDGVATDTEIDDGAVREAERLLPKVGSAPLLLSVGSTVSRKRIDVLLRVFAGVRRSHPDARLIRVGGPLSPAQAELGRQLGVMEAITELPLLERAVLSAVYGRSTLLLQPSEAEGFGLPVAEAMARGCPVVSSDIPVLRETGDGAAVYCPVGDVPAWTETVSRLLHQRRETPALWQQFQERSLRNASRFSWRRNAEQVAEIYRQSTCAGIADREKQARNVNGER